MTRGRPARGAALGALLLALLPSPAPAAQEPDLPRLLVLATGGTIASRPDAPQLRGTELVEAVPELARHARLTVEQVASVGSSAMTPDHWLRLARRVNEAFDADPGLAGVLVTHGTDSMEETAYFLHLTVRDERPVVLVGSMRSATAVSADGPANLIAAVRTATSPDARGKGVLVVLNDWIHSARDVRKMDSNRVDTFRSEWGPLGLVDADGVIFRRTLTTRHTTTSAFDVSGVEALPEVALVADFAGHDGSGVLEAGARARGVVLQAFANGRTSPGASRAVEELVARGIPVVLASRVPEGRVMARRRDDAEAEGRPAPVTAGDLAPHKARVLLMLALTRTSDPSGIQRLFDSH